MKRQTAIITAFIALVGIHVIQADTSIRFSFVSSDDGADTTAFVLQHKNQGEELKVSNRPLIVEDDIQSARETSDANGFGIALVLSQEGAEKFNSAIAGMKGTQLAILVNERLISAPVLQTDQFGNRIQISGNFSEEEAKKIAEDLTKNE